MHDQAVPARVTKRARILAYPYKHPGQTAYEICVALDAQRPNGSVAGSVFQLLRDMERKGQVVATKEFRPGLAPGRGGGPPGRSRRQHGAHPYAPATAAPTPVDWREALNQGSP
jgi:hypothetical protein